MRLTALGWRALLFLAVLWATFFAIPYTNLYFFGITFLSVWTLLAGYWTWRNVHGLRVRGRAGCGPAGSPFHLELEVDPRGRSRTNVEVVLYLPGGAIRSKPTSVAGSATSLTAEFPPLSRGVHGVQRARLESRAPFGLFCARVPLADCTELVVHPAPAPHRARRDRGGRGQDPDVLGTDGRPPRAHQVSGLRDFRVGDDARSVHWRGSARRGTLVVREMDPEPETSREVVLDRRCSDEALEATLAAIVATGLRAREEKATLHLRTQGLTRAFACDGADFDALLRVLAELQVVGPDAGPPPAGRARGRGGPP